MEKMLIFRAGSTGAVKYACELLARRGVTFADAPGHGVTHLLLDVPSFGPDGALRSGGGIEELLARLPGDITICGGNLDPPALAAYSRIDLLQDAGYLAGNAWITAECALDVLLPRYGGLIRDCPVLILGWGRIGKCLARLLRSMGAKVTVAARKQSDLAMLTALGYGAADTAGLTKVLPCCCLIFNTVPTLLLTGKETALCAEGCLMIDLASSPGIEGADVITARGLPGIHRPEASGRLIADTLLRLLNKEESL